MSEHERETLAQSMLGAIPPLVDLAIPEPSLKSGQAGEIFFQSYSPNDFRSVINTPFDTPTTGVGELHLPPQLSAKVPAMVFLPGSGGYVENRRRSNWAKWFCGIGWAVFFVDHYRPRGIDADKDYGISLLAISVFDRVADAYGALNCLSSHPNINASCIALMGLSLGGSTTRCAMDERFRIAYASDREGFSGFVDFYGPCTENLGTRRTNGKPLLTVRGSNDASNDLNACSKAIENYKSLGVRVKDKIYEGAPHGWDATYEPVFLAKAPYLVGCNTTYDERGVPHYKAQMQPVAKTGAGRLAKIQARLAAMGAAAGDLKFGYLNGRDETTARQAESDLHTFLESVR